MDGREVDRGGRQIDMNGRYVDLDGRYSILGDKSIPMGAKSRSGEYMNTRLSGSNDWAARVRI